MFAHANTNPPAGTPNPPTALLLASRASSRGCLQACSFCTAILGNIPHLGADKSAPASTHRHKATVRLSKNMTACSTLPHNPLSLLAMGSACDKGFTEWYYGRHATQWTYRRPAALAVLQQACHESGLAACLPATQGGLTAIMPYSATQWTCHENNLTACLPLSVVLRQSCHTVGLQTTCLNGGITPSKPRKWSHSMPATQSGLIEVMPHCGLTDNMPQRR